LEPVTADRGGMVRSPHPRSSSGRRPGSGTSCAVHSCGDSSAGRGQGPRQAVRARPARQRQPVRVLDGTRGDTERAPWRLSNHEVPHKGRAS